MHFRPKIMHDEKKSFRRRRVAVLVFPSFSNHCLANAIEPLRAANSLLGIEVYAWDYLSLAGGPVTSSSGLTVETGSALSDHPGGDYLFVMPSYDFRAHATPACARALRAARRRFKTLVGMDMGSWLLASADLLSGRKATIHWDELTNFAESFPDVDVEDSRVVHDGDILSCGGTTTTFDLILDLVETHHGAMLRLEIVSLFMYGETSPRTMTMLPPHPRQMPEAGVAMMRRNVEKPLPIATLAAQLGITRKAFERCCMQRFGIGPQRLYLATRLREAKRLIGQSGMSVTEIASRCGYRDASAMTRAFRKEFGLTPRELRRPANRPPTHGPSSSYSHAAALATSPITIK
jgi:AraC family transcriptional regulator, carnitine catabolism transcriptional activator